MKTKLILVVAIILFQWCKAQQSQTATLSKVENHLNGELDYTHEVLQLVQKQQNGEEIILGTINKDGEIKFNLPEFDIKALYDSIPLQHYNFFSLFLMNSDCKDRDLFAKTPFNDVYSEKFDPMYIKKYGENVAILFPATDEEMFNNNDYYRNNNYDGKNLVLGTKFYWFYIDRAIAFKDKCIKTPIRDNDTIELAISADIQLKKGWNFIEEQLVAVQEYNTDDYSSTRPKKIQFNQSSPNSKKVKWFVRQIMKDEDILAAKKLHELVPISKAQFKKWLPKKVGDLKRTSYELDKALDDSDSKSNNAFVVFESGNQKMEIAILDGAKNPDDLEMANFSFAMDKQYERDDKPTSDTTETDATDKGEANHISKEDKENKTSQIMALFKDRIVLYASGENVTSEELWDYIKKLKVEKLLKK
ncbi:hypothetical protein [Psychroserpens jangbogonensis]|uniref:hypothetical protein n=1 Tax=Psychroserpens jangbogonensis TaxID=1484460 RepID=UPI00053E81EE|nr:hypothetical protein [Psychroserpens jangbogonensis]